VLAFSVVGVAETRDDAQRYEDLSLFASVIDLVRNNYVEEVDEHELLMSAMRGILKGLDPHSAFMNPDAFEDMQVETKGEFQGLGIEISKQTRSAPAFRRAIGSPRSARPRSPKTGKRNVAARWR